MLPDNVVNFREMVTLKDGTYILLRPMIAEDEVHLVEFFAAVSEEDLRYFRHNVRDAQVVHEWCEHLDYGRVLPVLAIAKERVVGSASLHFNEGPKRHIAEVRLFLARDYRKRGLGTQMMRALIELARKLGLDILMAEIVTDESKMIKAFGSLGFKTRATLDDYFMFPDGDLHDVSLMTMSLHPESDEF